MKNKVASFEVLDRAFADIEKLKKWYDFKRPGQGKLLGKEIEVYLKYIKKNPEAFEKKFNPFFIASLKIHQVAIAYLYEKRNVTIFSVYSTHQDNTQILGF